MCQAFKLHVPNQRIFDLSVVELKVLTNPWHREEEQFERIQTKKQTWRESNQLSLYHSQNNKTKHTKNLTAQNI